jgi:hypothetical protein
VVKRAADVFGASVVAMAVAGTVDGLRVLAAAGSLAITGAVLILLDATHPAAAASTLLVSLGCCARRPSWSSPSARSSW